MPEKLKVGVIPAGIFGIAIGTVFAENGHKVTFGYRPESEERYTHFLMTGTDLRFPGINLPTNIGAAIDLVKLTADSDLIVFATRSRHVETTFDQIKPAIKKDTVVVSIIKGFVPATNQRISEYLISQDRSLSDRLAVLSGPNFAHDVVRRLPAVTVIASKSQTLARRLQKDLSTSTFRPYISNDMTGVELGGALKNPYAMAVGIVEGMQLGASASGAMQNAGLWEMIHLAVRLGADQNTIVNFAGAGDLSISCKALGRNYLAGFQIGQGADPKSLLESKMTVEGLDSVRSAVALARQKNVDVPILEILEGIIYNGLTLETAGKRLMSRDLTYAEPQPIVDHRFVRLVNQVLYFWGKKYHSVPKKPRIFGLW